MKADDRAFPADARTQTDGGLSVRDYIAIKAMQSLIIATIQIDSYDEEKLSRDSYKYADAMIAESQKESQ